jgi:predicted RNase H-like HicB family nuclease
MVTTPATVAELTELTVPVTVEYLEDDHVYKVGCPALQGCWAWGTTLDEALRATPANIRAMLEARRATGSPHPPLFEHAGAATPLVLRLVPA